MFWRKDEGQQGSDFDLQLRAVRQDARERDAAPPAERAKWGMPGGRPFRAPGSLSLSLNVILLIGVIALAALVYFTT